MTLAGIGSHNAAATGIGDYANASPLHQWQVQKGFGEVIEFLSTVYPNHPALPESGIVDLISAGKAARV
jgi:hypothetical protein